MSFLLQLICVFLILSAGCSARNSGVPAKLDCIANLKQLDGAKIAWEIAQHKTTNDPPSMQDWVGRGRFLQEVPRCRSGGFYALGKVGEKPRCSIEGHEL